MERKKFSYDEYGDSLIVSCRSENEVVEDNFEVGDIIFSLSGDGKILSIEIRGVSGFLDSCDIDSNILKNIKNAELRVVFRKDTIFLILKMEISEGFSVIYHDIPLVLPLINQKGYPYRRGAVAA